MSVRRTIDAATRFFSSLRALRFDLDQSYGGARKYVRVSSAGYPQGGLLVLLSETLARSLLPLLNIIQMMIINLRHTWRKVESILIFPFNESSLWLKKFYFQSINSSLHICKIEAYYINVCYVIL